jgi:hypothetical protein
MRSWLIVLLLVFLPACQFIMPDQRSKEDIAYDKEYDFTRTPIGKTTQGTTVIGPNWLASEDGAETIKNVGDCIRIIDENYRIDVKNGQEFPWHKLTVLIHDNLDICVAGYGLRIWCYGWTTNYYIVICWASNEGPSTTGLEYRTPRNKDPLPALAHEFFHPILAWNYGTADGTHSIFFNTIDVQWAIRQAREGAAPTDLSNESMEAAVAFKYTPWCSPKNESMMGELSRMLRNIITELREIKKKIEWPTLIPGDAVPGRKNPTEPTEEEKDESEE